MNASLEVARDVRRNEAPMLLGPPSILLKKNLKDLYSPKQELGEKVRDATNMR